MPLEGKLKHGYNGKFQVCFYHNAKIYMANLKTQWGAA